MTRYTPYVDKLIVSAPNMTSVLYVPLSYPSPESIHLHKERQVNVWGDDCLSIEILLDEADKAWFSSCLGMEELTLVRMKDSFVRLTESLRDNNLTGMYVYVMRFFCNSIAAAVPLFTITLLSTASYDDIHGLYRTTGGIFLYYSSLLYSALISIMH